MGTFDQWFKKPNRVGTHKLDSIEMDCFLCGAHHMQGCSCDYNEVEKAKNEFKEKMKSAKVTTMTFAEWKDKLGIK